MSACVISFSSRKNGNCAQIGRYVCSLLTDVKYYDFSDITLHPCGNCSYECFTDREKCTWKQDKEYALLEDITNSAFTCFILPNYCDYPCANFFIFNERSQLYFQGHEDLLNAYESVPKKFIVVSNTNRENFETALSYHSVNKPDILFLPARKYGKVSIEGDLLTSEEALLDIAMFMTQKTVDTL